MSKHIQSFRPFESGDYAFCIRNHFVWGSRAHWECSNKCRKQSANNTKRRVPHLFNEHFFHGNTISASKKMCQFYKNQPNGFPHNRVKWPFNWQFHGKFPSMAEFFYHNSIWYKIINILKQENGWLGKRERGRLVYFALRMHFVGTNVGWKICRKIHFQVNLSMGLIYNTVRYMKRLSSPPENWAQI